MEKLMKWRELAENFQGKDFWSWIFEDSNNSPLSSDFMDMFGAGGAVSNVKKPQYPRKDIVINNEEIIVSFELPGLSKEDIGLSINGENLHIKGEVKNELSEYKSVVKERYIGGFEQTIKLPERVKKDKAIARFNNGVLQVRLPREHKGNIGNIKID